MTARLHRWARAARLDAVSVALATVYAVVRLVATLGQPITEFADSPSYFVFKLWGGVRFPVVTAFYAVVGDHRAIVTIQALVGAVCWPVAAVVAASVVGNRWVRDVLVAAILLLGLTLPVTRFDNTLLSESITISLTVLLVALVLRFACVPTHRSAFAVFIVTVVWALSRQNNAAMIGVAAVVLFAVGAGRVYRRTTWRLAGALLAIALVGLVLATSTSQIQEYNTAAIVVRRVLPDSEREAWFLRHGMPADGPAVASAPFAKRIGDPAVALQHDPQYGRWLRGDAQWTYINYLLTHPAYVIRTPFTHDGALPGIATGVTFYGKSRAAVPHIVETSFWPATGGVQTLMAVLAFGIMVVAVIGAVQSRGVRRAAAGGFGILVVAVTNVLFVTHTAGWEYERLLIPTSVAARVALLFLLGAAIGRVDAGDT